LNCFFSASNNGHAWAAIIGILTIGIILLWNYVPSRLKVLPSALVAVIISTLIAYALNLPIKYISIPPNIFEGIKFLSLSSFNCIFDYKIIIAAISITFIASAETLISAAAIDKITKYSKTNYNREILSQGIGNILAGFFCVLPLTGVIVRSAANVHSGAVTRKSTILHGIWLLLFILCLPFVLKLVPTACLAALLVYTGYKLVELQEAKKIYMLSKGEFIIFLITVLAVIATNFLDGILIGISASFIKNIYKSFKSTINIEYSNGNKIVTIKMIGNLTFIKLPQITNMIEKIEPKKQIVIDFNRLSHIDHACIDILLDWSEQYKKTGGEITIDWEPVKVIYPSFGWNNVVEA
jgi:MFS superfamily sulfate permease-like transporter